MFNYRYHTPLIISPLGGVFTVTVLRGTFWVRIPIGVVSSHKGDARKFHGILKRQKKPSLVFFWRFKIPRMTQVYLVYVYPGVHKVEGTSTVLYILLQVLSHY